MNALHLTPEEINVPDRLPILPKHRRGVPSVKLDVEQIRWMRRAERRAAFERAIEIVKQQMYLVDTIEKLEAEMNGAR